MSLDILFLCGAMLPAFSFPVLFVPVLRDFSKKKDILNNKGNPFPVVEIRF